MEQDKLWARFTRTGKVSDYLAYCGIDLVGGENTVATDIQEDSHETDHRRADHSGKQQYR